MNKLIVLTLLLGLKSVVFSQTDTAITNHIYDPNIQTVQLYLATGTFSEQQNPATRYIQQETPLVLEFDELIVDYSDFNVKIIHCNADWKGSGFQEVFYMEDFNEFYIRDIQPGFNTRVQYNHYRFEVPKVKVSGNYILMVYRNENEEDIVLTQRFMVYEEWVNVIPKLDLPASGARETQQINFSVNYSNAEIFNPAQQVKVVIRQNNRWDNAKFDVKPTFINENRKQLDYIRMGTDNKFDGGNEFRAFDARSVLTTGLNVFKIYDLDSMFMLKLRPEEPRGANAYLTYNDINGGYIIEHYEYNDPQQGDYVLVNFRIEMPQLLGDIYVFGDLSNWELQERFKMYYDQSAHSYEAFIQLKQGYYNYKFMAVKNDGSLYEHLIEGNHFETENLYEILFYYNPPGQLNDLLVGHALFNMNAKN